jgi:hypothetical protein
MSFGSSVTSPHVSTLARLDEEPVRSRGPMPTVGDFDRERIVSGRPECDLQGHKGIESSSA